MAWQGWDGPLVCWLVGGPTQIRDSQLQGGAWAGKEVWALAPPTVCASSNDEVTTKPSVPPSERRTVYSSMRGTRRDPQSSACLSKSWEHRMVLTRAILNRCAGDTRRLLYAAGA